MLHVFSAGPAVTFTPHRRSRTQAGRLGWAVALCLSLTALASAQEEKKPPPPEEISLETKDGVIIKATYYPGMAGKDSVPVMCIHPYKGNRHDYDNLAMDLQKEQNCAVLIPDLRGHGDSTSLVNSPKKLEVDEMRMDQLLAIPGKGGDLEVAKNFLVTKNNEGQLNIDKLSIVGAEMGATLAVMWTGLDWGWPVLATGKQGQDVKALVLISPEMAYKRLKMVGDPYAPGLGTPGVREQVSVYIAVGKGTSSSVSDARRVYQLFAPYHKNNTKPEDRDLFFDDSFATKLQGAKLLGAGLGLNKKIGEFITLRAGGRSFPWAERKNPLGG
jgi:pimeloyl-ACP methyl ester carboxylesterase